MTFEFDEIGEEQMETFVGACKKVYYDPKFRVAVKRVATAVVVAAAITAIKYGYKEYQEYRFVDLVDTIRDLV